MPFLPRVRCVLGAAPAEACVPGPSSPLPLPTPHLSASGSPCTCSPLRFLQTVLPRTPGDQEGSPDLLPGTGISFGPRACAHVLPFGGGLGSRASQWRWEPRPLAFSRKQRQPAFWGPGAAWSRGWDTRLAAQLSRGLLRLSFPGFRFPSLEVGRPEAQVSRPPSSPSSGAGSDGAHGSDVIPNPNRRGWLGGAGWRPMLRAAVNFISRL